MATWMYVIFELISSSLSSFLVTPPLKNVRKRRFRKVARQKTQDHDEIEKEVRRLFR
jgi:transcription initiation factor TFIID subunit 7